MILSMEGVEENIGKVREIAVRRGLSLVVVFGSQATGRTHKGSDMDIAVLGREPVRFDERAKIASELDSVFGRRDVEVADIDPNSASPTLMYAVVRDGKLLYEAEEGGFMRWKLYAIKMWMETAWLRELRDKKLVEWAAKS
jgi:predicted nucleotidyltransferase